LFGAGTKKQAQSPACPTDVLEAIVSFRGGQSADIDDIIKRLELNNVIKKDGDNVVYLVD